MTAYEMRISDWRSDLGSSDLALELQELVVAVGELRLAGAEVDRHVVHPRALGRVRRGFDRRVAGCLDRCGRQAGVLVGVVRRVDLEEIGRASCGERVCRYV